MAWRCPLGAAAKRLAGVVSISMICCLMKRRRPMSRRSSASVFAGAAAPSGVRKAFNWLDAFLVLHLPDEAANSNQFQRRGMLWLGTPLCTLGRNRPLWRPKCLG